MPTSGLSEEPPFVISTSSVLCGTKKTPKYFVLYPTKSVFPEYCLEPRDISEAPPPKRLADPTL